VRLLIDNKANVELRDKDRKTALVEAARTGEDKCVKLLVDAKACVNQQNHDGLAGLHAACSGVDTGRARHADCVCLRINGKADVHLQDIAGATHTHTLKHELSIIRPVQIILFVHVHSRPPLGDRAVAEAVSTDSCFLDCCCWESADCVCVSVCFTDLG
jgi:hypothetical protein